MFKWVTVDLLRGSIFSYCHFDSRIFILGTITALLCFYDRADGSFIEDAGYKIMKEVLIAQGESEMRAECFVTVLKYMGVSSDLSIFGDYRDMMKKLKAKSQTADFVCSNFGFVAAVLLVFFVVSILCICLMRFC